MRILPLAAAIEALTAAAVEQPEPGPMRIKYEPDWRVTSRLEIAVLMPDGKVRMIVVEPGAEPSGTVHEFERDELSFMDSRWRQAHG